jgi:hypothetical protein
VHPVHACIAPFAFGDNDYLLVLIYWHPCGTCWHVAAAVCVCLCGAQARCMTWLASLCMMMITPKSRKFACSVIIFGKLLGFGALCFTIFFQVKSFSHQSVYIFTLHRDRARSRHSSTTRVTPDGDAATPVSHPTPDCKYSRMKKHSYLPLSDITHQCDMRHGPVPTLTGSHRHPTELGTGEQECVGVGEARWRVGRRTGGGLVA